MVLEQMKKIDPRKIITEQQVENIIACGVSIWDEAIADPEADVSDMLSVSFYSVLDENGLKLPNNAELVPDAEIYQMLGGSQITCLPMWMAQNN
jgi:hypothetical protein